MKINLKNRYLLLADLLVIWILVLSCAFFPQAASSTQLPGKAPKAQGTQSGKSPAGSQPANQTGQATPTADESQTGPRPDPLDRLLTLRSVKINMTSLFPDGTSRVIDIEIDASGNLHVKYSLPAPDPTTLPKDVKLNNAPTSREVFVISGKGYHPSPNKANWKDNPDPTDTIQVLSDDLHGGDGPALYLDLLPEGSIHPAGKDNVGGFDADKYTVSGQLSGQSVSGTIWFEPKADALIQADLTVPAGLMSDPAKPQQGSLKISLTTQQANIPPINLPDIPTTPAQPQSTP